MSDERNVPQRVLQPVVEHSQDLFGPARRDGIDGKQLDVHRQDPNPGPDGAEGHGALRQIPGNATRVAFRQCQGGDAGATTVRTFANQDKRESIATGEAISVKPTSETSSAAQPTQRVRLRDGTSKRRRCWSSAEAAPDPVGGDTAPPAEGIESGQRPPPRRREWFARRNDCSRRPEVGGRRRGSAASVEAAGGDPGDLQVVEAKSP